jgi:predicted nucleic acid-binding Zn ribbon protein
MKPCAVCEKKFTPYRCRKTCSDACADELERRTKQKNNGATMANMRCLVCLKAFYGTSKRKTCSHECSRAWLLKTEKYKAEMIAQVKAERRTRGQL